MPELAYLLIDELVGDILVHLEDQLDRPVVVEDYALVAFVFAPVFLIGIIFLLELSRRKLGICLPWFAFLKYGLYFPFVQAR